MTIPPASIAGKSYLRHRLVYFENGKRVVRQFASLEDARSEARAVGRALASGRGAVLDYKPDELALFEAASKLLGGSGFNLLEAINVFLATQRAKAAVSTVPSWH